MGRDVVLVTIGGTKKKSNKHSKEYRNKVQNSHRSKKKNIKWKSESNIFLDKLVTEFDIEQWEDAEKLFYKDKKYMTKKL